MMFARRIGSWRIGSWRIGSVGLAVGRAEPEQTQESAGSDRSNVRIGDWRIPLDPPETFKDWTGGEA